MDEVAKAVNANDRDSYRNIVAHYECVHYSRLAIQMMESYQSKLDPWQHLQLLIGSYICVMNGYQSNAAVQEVIKLEYAITI